jgi:hypothetical protein
MDQFQYEQTTMLGEQKVVKESDEKILEDRISEIGDSLSESEVEEKLKEAKKILNSATDNHKNHTTKHKILMKELF